MAQINQIQSKLNNHRGILFIHKAKPNPNIPTHRYLKINVHQTLTYPKVANSNKLYGYGSIRIYTDPILTKKRKYGSIIYIIHYMEDPYYTDLYGSHTNKKAQIRIRYIYYILYGGSVLYGSIRIPY